jgi:hypothetical protein
MEEFDTSGDGVHANWPDRFFAKIVDAYLTTTGESGRACRRCHVLRPTRSWSAGVCFSPDGSGRVRPPRGGQLDQAGWAPLGPASGHSSITVVSGPLSDQRWRRAKA